jgi:hypothetical protein
MKLAACLNIGWTKICPGLAQQPAAPYHFPSLGTEITDETRKMQKFAFNWKQFPNSANLWRANIIKSAAPKSAGEVAANVRWLP